MASSAAVKALHQQGTGKQDADSQEISHHGLEVESLDTHPAHGAKKQGRREQQKNQVLEVFNGLRPYPACATSYKTCSNQQNNPEQRHKNKRVHGAILAPVPNAPSANIFLQNRA